MKYNTPAVDVFMRMSSSYRLSYETTNEPKRRSIPTDYNESRSPGDPKRKLLTIVSERKARGSLEREKYVLQYYPPIYCNKRIACYCRDHVLDNVDGYIPFFHDIISIK